MMPIIACLMPFISCLMPIISGVRRAGSAALDLADVARGRFDGFWELFLNPWDLAAGVLLVREAGGRVTDLEGRDARLTSGPIVAKCSQSRCPVAIARTASCHVTMSGSSKPPRRKRMAPSAARTFASPTR